MELAMISFSLNKVSDQLMFILGVVIVRSSSSSRSTETNTSVLCINTILKMLIP
jgi:hypothetical protein